jgi:predicted DNA-binding protein
MPARDKTRLGTQYLFRFPPGLKKKLWDRADQNGRSLAAELLCAIERHLEDLNRFENLEKRISDLEQKINITGTTETYRKVANG